MNVVDAPVGRDSSAQRLGEAVFDGLDAAPPVFLAAGEVLVSEGDEPGDAYYVRAGRLEAVTRARSGDVVLAQLGPGELTGELAVVTGRRRTATLRAAEPSVVVPIPRTAFLARMRARPDIADAVMAAAREHLDRARVAVMIESLVGADNATCIQDVLDALEWRRLEAGAILFEEDEATDAAYFLVSGRLVASRRGLDGATVRLSEIGNGEVVGERGLIDGTARNATVRALRDCTLARFSTVSFAALLTRHAALALQVMRTVVHRVDAATSAGPRATAVTVVFGTAADQARVMPLLLAEMARLGSVCHLSSERVDALLGEPGASQLGTDSVGVPRLTELLHHVDIDHDHVVFETDRSAAVSAWDRRGIRHADRVVLFVSAKPDPQERDHMRAYVDELHRVDSASVWLVVLHRDGTRRPSGTADALRRCGGDEVVHVRQDRPHDVARLARLLTGQGIGLVLSGGGARGFAHVGVYRALRELGIALDWIGGASIGAPIGAGIALDLSPSELLDTVTRQFHRLLDYTLPVVSVLKGERITRSIDDALGGLGVEDLWLGYYCVSTNLTASRLELHRRGDLALAVRASVAIPGVLPPVAHNGDLLVDGGVLSNLPVAPMRAHPGIGRLIAVDVALNAGATPFADYGSSVSGWRALRARLDRRGAAYPSLADVLMRTMVVGSSREHAATPSGPDDLRIEIPLEGIGLLDFKRVGPVAQAGYEVARPMLERWSTQPTARSSTEPSAAPSAPEG